MHQQATVRRGKRVFYGWVIVAVGVMVFSLAYGVRYSFSVVFPSLLEQFGWARDTTAAILSFHILAYGVFAPVAGAMVDRFGARKTMGLGAILLATGAAASSLGNALWHYYLSFGLVMGVGLALIGDVPFTRVVANWFVAKRGLALSLMFCGAGGAYLMYPLVAFLIGEVGWRGAFMVEAVMVAVLLLPSILLLIRSHPEDKGLLADGSSEVVAGPAEGQGQAQTAADDPWAATEWTLPRAMKQLRFWALCAAAFAVWGITLHILVAHHVAFAVDAGFDILYASAVLALFGVFISAGALASSISDRIGRETTFAIGTIVGVSGIIVLLLIRDASHPWMLYLYSILFGTGFGLITPTLAAAATDMFQGPRAGAVIGFVWFAFAVGGAIGPWLGGFVFEASGSYLPAFIVAAAMFVIAGISLWVAAPRRARVDAGEAQARRWIRRSSSQEV